MLKRSLFLFLFIACFVPAFAHAATGADLRVDPLDIRFSKSPLVAGDSVRLYTKVKNVGTIDVVGYVIFYQGSMVISEPQVISLVAGSDPEEAFVDFVVPTSAFNIRTVISGTKPEDINLDNNVAITTMFTPILDDDHDGVANASDNCPKVSNANQLNTDHDAFGDACDDDMDNDGLSNAVEAELGTNPRIKDTDADGTEDAHDAYPLDPKRWILEKPVPVVVKPAPKPLVQVKLASELAIPTKTESPIPATTKSDIVSSGLMNVTGSTQLKEGASVAQQSLDADSTKTAEKNVSSNAVFTYEKSSWNTFLFRLIAPPQEHSVYEWNFGDGVRSSKTTIKHVYAQAGTYHVSLKTTNENGDIRNESADVRVTFFSLSNPWIIGLMSLLGFLLLGTLIVWFKLKSKKRLTKKEEDVPLKQIHVKEE